VPEVDFANESSVSESPERGRLGSREDDQDRKMKCWRRGLPVEREEKLTLITWPNIDSVE